MFESIHEQEEKIRNTINDESNLNLSYEMWK